LHADDAGHCPHCGYSPARIKGFVAWTSEAAQRGVHFDPRFFSELAAYEEQNFWFQARNALIVAMLRRYAPRMISFLEIGCGTGFVLKAVGEAFPGVRQVGSEVFVEGLSIAVRRNPQAELVQMDARVMPYVEAFDVVSAFDVLEHIAEDERVLANLFTAARPGGLLIASVPQHPFLWSTSDEIGHHVRRYQRNELQRKVTAAGFELIRSTSFVSLLLPVLVLSRLGKQTTETLDPMAEFRIPPWFNSSLGCVLALERAAIRVGLNFPFGGSRLVVARRA
jgi:SAM-dependent methyltransferase